jgi:hypothetical protein
MIIWNIRIRDKEGDRIILGDYYLTNPPDGDYGKDLILKYYERTVTAISAN